LEENDHLLIFSAAVEKSEKKITRKLGILNVTGELDWEDGGNCLRERCNEEGEGE
jgi:hypothetical protein